MLDQDIFNKFTKHLKNALQIAGRVAKEKNRPNVTPIHLLSGIMRQPGSLAAEILHKNGLTETPYPLPKDPNNNSRTITLELNTHAQKIITKMLNLAFAHQHLYVGTEHLLMAILSRPDEEILQLLKSKNISLNKLRNHVETVLNSTSHFADLTDIFSEMMNSAAPSTDGKAMWDGTQTTSEKNAVLELFATDLTDSATQKKIDPVIGREAEIERVIQILSRRHKNNPLLLGDPGVGKTAIVEGLAKKINQGDVPEVLRHKRILNLDLGLMIAGTMYRGEFESRLKNILEEIKHDPNVIVFIDELHNIIGAGSTTGGTLDVANLIKPALARGEIRCIGATTLSEYHKFIESDPALERRFQTIQVDEPTPAESVKILSGLKSYYELFHQVTISDDALRTAVNLSIRYLPDKFLPDKAIDLIDEAASRLKVKTAPHPLQKNLRELSAKVDGLTAEKNRAISEELYDEAIRLKQLEDDTKQKIARLKEKIRQTHIAKPDINSEHIAEIVSQMTHIPLTYLTETNDKKLQLLEKRLNQHVVGQTEAVEQMVNVMKRAQLGLSHPNRPLGSFLFLGPSGVGKTELAKTLAREYFGSEDNLIRIDMSEFSESFNISKLIGAPAGYVGYREGGKITDAIRRRPYSVVLFDEIEKGHPDVFNLLLQILDEGYISDAEGRRINFRHSIIILTSNIGSDKFNSQSAFGFELQPGKEKYTWEQVKQQVLDELSENFRPELINRLDRIIVFNSLNKENLGAIVRLQLKELNQRLQAKKLNLQITPRVAMHVANISYAPNKGAREIRRNLEQLIEQPLANLLLTGDANKFRKAKAVLDKKKIKIHVIA